MINSLSLDVSVQTKTKIFEISFVFKDKLSDAQKEESLKYFPDIIEKNPQFSFQFLVDNWQTFSPIESKFTSISNLLNTQQLDAKKNRIKIFLSIKSDLESLEIENKFDYIEGLCITLKGSVAKRTFFADLLEKLNKTIPLKDQIRFRDIQLTKIDKEPDIDLCRNWFSIINKFKRPDYEKRQRCQ